MEMDVLHMQQQQIVKDLLKEMIKIHIQIVQNVQLQIMYYTMEKDVKIIQQIDMLKQEELLLQYQKPLYIQIVLNQIQMVLVVFVQIISISDLVFVVIMVKLLMTIMYVKLMQMPLQMESAKWQSVFKVLKIHAVNVQLLISYELVIQILNLVVLSGSFLKLLLVELPLESINVLVIQI